MTKIVLGVIQGRDIAEHAVEELESAGFSSKEISIIMKDSDDVRKIRSHTGESIAEGALSGTTAGGLIGGLAGFLIGIGAVAIPGIGALLIGGPIAAALGLTGAAALTASGAVTGALAGGLVGALVGLGLPKKDAEAYEEQIRSGGILIAVPALAEDEDRARDILEEHGAFQVKSIEAKGYSSPRTYRARGYEEERYSYAGAKGGEVGREANLDLQDVTDDFRASRRGR